jgi:hypothetical protein
MRRPQFVIAVAARLGDQSWTKEELAVSNENVSHSVVCQGALYSLAVGCSFRRLSPGGRGVLACRRCAHQSSFTSMFLASANQKSDL